LVVRHEGLLVRRDLVVMIHKSSAVTNRLTLAS